MAETLNETLAKRSRAEDETAELRMFKVRERIRKNFPDERAALQWRRDSATRLVSTCGRFAIEKHGEGEAARYTAKLQPHSIIGNRRYTLEQAKEDCNSHASPLPLEPPLTEAVEREPGSDDE
jgi:hypothetical protein